MNLLALLGALVLSYYRPHQRSDWLRQLYAPYAQLLQRKCDDGKKVHGVIAWMLGALLPALAIGIVYYLLLEVFALLGLLFGIAVLYVTLRFSRYGQYAEKIVRALREGNVDEARDLYARWENTEDQDYTMAEIARLGIETTLTRSHYGLLAPIFWFVLLGPGGALLYRLTLILRQEWQAQGPTPFSHCVRRVFDWLDWLPARVTSACFAVVGDFEDAVYCWRTQAEAWSDKSLGIVLASGAGALGVKLGEPLQVGGVLVYRPEMGMGDEADADYLQGAVALVWRVLVLMVSLFLLLTFAHWLGN